MSQRNESPSTGVATDAPIPANELEHNLAYLKLPFLLDHYAELAQRAAAKHWSHVHYLSELLQGEAACKRDRSTHRRIQRARFPARKTLEQFQWNWPKTINRLQIQNLARLQFVQDKSNVIFLGGVGLGKTHLASALGYLACLKGYSVLFAAAVDVINTLSAAKATGRLKSELKKYATPSLLILD